MIVVADVLVVNARHVFLTGAVSGELALEGTRNSQTLVYNVQIDIDTRCRFAVCLWGENFLGVTRKDLSGKASPGGDAVRRTEERGSRGLPAVVGLLVNAVVGTPFGTSQQTQSSSWNKRCRSADDSGPELLPYLKAVRFPAETTWKICWEMISIEETQ